MIFKVNTPDLSGLCFTKFNREKGEIVKMNDLGNAPYLLPTSSMVTAP